jgi:hypothetical protein
MITTEHEGMIINAPDLSLLAMTAAFIFVFFKICCRILIKKTLEHPYA